MQDFCYLTTDPSNCGVVKFVFKGTFSILFTFIQNVCGFQNICV